MRESLYVHMLVTTREFDENGEGLVDKSVNLNTQERCS
ncbi:putative conjugative transfer protein TraA [Orientia tsutsugamushi str. Gilliam]|uniref:Putative conjugative transfer protein TraA n=1 Tax=Orientia tsutsugamushi str. Gilliam TaxID=1359184 RepID=A0A0F3MD03_ORITS|nr:putative conjugative transfer protein TraA [Orientia tsutsugamushi str. Gilliam]